MWTPGSDPSVTSDKKFQLQDICYQYEDIFSSSETDLGRTDIEHKINPGNHQPMRQSSRRIPSATLPEEN